MSPGGSMRELACA